MGGAGHEELRERLARELPGGDNTIQMNDMGGLLIADWGDNRSVPSPEVERQLHNLDVLILPIDGPEHILTYAEIAASIEKYRCKVVVPGNYLIPGLTTSASTFEPAAASVAIQRDVKRAGTGATDLSPEDLRGAHGRVFYSSPSVTGPKLAEHERAMDVEQLRVAAARAGNAPADRQQRRRTQSGGGPRPGS